MITSRNGSQMHQMGSSTSILEPYFVQKGGSSRSCFSCVLRTLFLPASRSIYNGVDVPCFVLTCMLGADSQSAWE